MGTSSGYERNSLAAQKARIFSSFFREKKGRWRQLIWRSPAVLPLSLSLSDDEGEGAGYFPRPLF